MIFPSRGSLVACLLGFVAGCPEPEPDGTDETSTGDASLVTTGGAETSSGAVDSTGTSSDGTGTVGSSGTSSDTGGTSSDTGGTSSDTGDTTSGLELPQAAVLELGFSQVKQFDFTWMAAAGADHYELLESAAPGEPFVQLGGDIVGESLSITMPLHLRFEASYVLRACNGAGCTDSSVVNVMGSLAEAVGYFKASNTDYGDVFGYSVALSDDGSTLAVGASGEESNATGIDGDQANDFLPLAGAVYVFVRNATDQWSQQAYVKPSNPDGYDRFGLTVALSGDGDTLAVGAYRESSNATGIDGNQASDAAFQAGAVYVFARDAMEQWSQQAYVKASNTDDGDWFSWSIALGDDGDTLAVGAPQEDSNATGIDGDQADESASNSGAVYVFVRDAMGQWSQEAYVKASNTDWGDGFGHSVALSGDGATLAVGADREEGNATGIDGDQADDSAAVAGAVYVLVRDAMGQWSQQAYVKASNTDAGDLFGQSVALSGDGTTLAVGAHGEDSNATGIDGNQANDSVADAGAVYVFVRDAMQQWSQQAYIKASNTDADDRFGHGVALNGDGNILAVGTRYEDGNATGIDGDQANDLAEDSGAVYVLVRDAMGQWSPQAYVKASNTDAGDWFGSILALSSDGSILAAAAHVEASNATGIGGNQADDSLGLSGAVYVF